MPECFVAKASDLHDGDRRIVVAGREEIGVFYKGGAYFAYSNYCVHSGGPACEGIMINRVVDVIADDRTYQGQAFSDEVHFVCPWHGYEFELKTGRVRRRPPPAPEEIRRRPARRRHLRRCLREMTDGYGPQRSPQACRRRLHHRQAPRARRPAGARSATTRTS